jgi:hypothetical protein
MVYGNIKQAAYGFTVGDLCAIRLELAAKGLTVSEINEYQGESCHFTDLDGNMIKLWQE